LRGRVKKGEGPFGVWETVVVGEKRGLKGKKKISGSSFLPEKFSC